MTSTIHYSKWDIVLVPFPFTDLSAYKRRPSLIISPEEYNRNDDLVIAFITSHITSEKRLGDYSIKNWIESGLPKPSIIRMKFSTVSKSIIIKKIGVLSKKDVTEFKAMLTKFFS